MNTSDYITIPLTQGQETIIDAVDADLAQLKWCAIKDRNGYYAARRGNGTSTLRLHRVILSRVLAQELLTSEQCDHINLDKLDNRRENLRLATPHQNALNRGITKANTSGYKGVSFHKKTGKWKATIDSNGRQFHLGLFLTPEEAHNAYCQAANQFHGEFARHK